MRINSTHTFAARGLDSYFTPPAATKALLAIEKLPLSVADPACGAGAILDVLKDAGHIVFGADIHDYGWPHTILRDYLEAPVMMSDVGIITNPPYRLAAEFVQKALDDGSTYAAFLLRLNFLESMRRKPFFDATPPSRIWVASRRLPMMHRLGWDGPIAPSNHAFAWFIYDQSSSDKAKIGWFDWKAAP